MLLNVLRRKAVKFCYQLRYTKVVSVMQRSDDLRRVIKLLKLLNRANAYANIGSLNFILMATN